MKIIHWTEYLEYRAKLRNFDLAKIEDILRYSTERYLDIATARLVAIGKHNGILVMIPYEENNTGEITPVTIHTTSRQQINYRLKCGRFRK